MGVNRYLYFVLKRDSVFHFYFLVTKQNVIFRLRYFFVMLLRNVDIFNISTLLRINIFSLNVFIIINDRLVNNVLLNIMTQAFR